MASDPSSLDARSASATARTSILHMLAEVALSTTNAQLDAFTSRLADALERTATSHAAPPEAERCKRAAQLLRKNRYAFHFVVSERLQATLQLEIEALAKGATSTPTPGKSKPLAPDLEVDKQVSLRKASRILDSEHADRLEALNRRLGHLLGKEAFTTTQNPFRPHIFLALIQDAWCEFCPDAEAHPLVFRLLGPYLCIDPAPILHALNSTLVKQGVLPKLTQPYQVEFGPAGNAEEETPADTASDDPLLIAQLRRLFPAGRPATARRSNAMADGSFPTLFADHDVQATAGRNALFSYLAEIQGTRFDRHLAACAGSGPEASSMFAHVKRQLPQGVLTPADENTIDLLSRIFDAVLRDKHIPDDIKSLIGSLQVPVLKTALLDKEFFFSEKHPARQMIELLTRLGIGWDRNRGQSDPLYRVIQRNVNRIHENGDQPAMFAKAAWELASFAMREDSAFEHTLSTPISQALQQEKKLEAARAARHEVALRTGTGEVVAFVEAFLEKKWVTVLTLAYEQQDDQPQQVEEALKTMDDLVWSVKPKITAAERKELIAKLPSMIADLNKWLDLIKWNPSTRARFFAELAKCHASIVRAPLELSPERQMQLALAAAKEATERRLRKEAARQATPEPDAFDTAVAGLERGAWLEFTQDNGLPMKLKLAWVSPMRNFYLFSTREKLEARQMTAEELALALREQRARVVRITGLIGRVLTEALCPESAKNEATRKSVA